MTSCSVSSVFYAVCARLGIAAPHEPDWALLPAIYASGRPEVCRSPQLRAPQLLPLAVASVGRGVPRGGCHLYQPLQEDLMLLAARAQSEWPAARSETPVLQERSR